MRNRLKKPKMIIFDFGGTLINGTDFNRERAYAAVLKWVSRNEKKITPKELNEFADKLFNNLSEIRKIGFEINGISFQNLLYETLGLEFRLPPYELEKIFWDNLLKFSPTPHIDETLTLLHEMKIRSSVISNITFNGKGLKRIINSNLPYNIFEFIITSGEYIVRKPNKIIFDLALKKANLNPCDVWFCGNDFNVDICGAANADIFPIWYDVDMQIDNLIHKPDFSYQHITDWKELISILSDID